MRNSIIIVVSLFFGFSVFSQDSISDKKKNTSFVLLEKVPIYKGCKGSNKELKKCFSKNIKKLIMKKISVKRINRLGLNTGKYKVLIQFKVSSKGLIERVQVAAPHEKIVKEIKRVLKKAPKMIPGELNGVPVGVKYALPLTIFVE